ncbi:imidazole glycerol phosphate synthase subunit HisH [bacterium]|nr:imidazole glycerol phosphate synthase subunit HisH [bacterium]
MITIIDYGMGNLRSVAKALEHLGLASEITSDPERIAAAERLILPGVGAFGDAMAELGRRGLIAPIRAYAGSDRPLIGICLGMQLLFDDSEEAPGVAGLGLIPGRVRRFEPGLKVPHMGWNTVRQGRPSPLFAGVPDNDYFYFVHSYYVDPAPEAASCAAGLTTYGIEFASVLTHGNVFATQFHPEKSQKRGLKMLENFANWS